jgi:hypothetical protein
MNVKKFLYKYNCYLIFIVFLFFIFNYYPYSYAESDISNSSVYYIFSNDSHVYNNFKRINLNFFGRYNFDIFSYNYSLRGIRGFTSDFNFFFYRNFFYVEDLDMFNYIDDYLNNKFKIKSSLSKTENLNLYYSFDFFSFKDNRLLDYSSSFKLDNLYFGDLFSKELNLTYNYIIYNSFYLGYLFLINSFFIFLFFVFFYYLLSYFFIYKGMFIVGYFFVGLYEDDDDNIYDDGSSDKRFLDKILMDNDYLYFSNTYYNIIRFEFNYLNYIIYSNKFILFWFYATSFSIVHIKNVGYLYYLKFLFSSYFYSKLEFNYLPSLINNEEIADWYYIAQDHILIAFPEYSFYSQNSLFSNEVNDYSSWFYKKEIVNNLLFINHPFAMLPFITYDEFHYELSEDYIRDTEKFIEKYYFSDLIMSTFKKRFITMYCQIKKFNYNLETSTNYAGSFNTFNEIFYRNASVDLEFLDESSYRLRDITNAYFINIADSFDRVDNISDVDFSLEDEHAFDVLANRSEIRMDVFKSYFKLYGANAFSNYKPSDLAFFYENQNSFNIFSKEGLNSFASYVKYNNVFFRSFGALSFSSLIFNSFYDIYYSKLKSEPFNYVNNTDFSNLRELLNAFSFDKKYMSSLLSVFNKLDFSEGFPKFLGTFRNYESLFPIYSSLKGSTSYSDYNNYPPYSNYIGYLLINPALRQFRDFYMFNFIKASSFKNMLYNQNCEITTFEFMKYNGYLVYSSDFPTGMVLSTDNIKGSSLYSNRNIIDRSQLELLEIEDTSVVVNKYNFSFIFIAFLIPFSCLLVYFSLILNRFIS